jgi:hypothetical protein
MLTDEEQHKISQSNADAIGDLLKDAFRKADNLAIVARIGVSASAHVNSILAMTLSPRGASKPTDEAICVAAMASYTVAPTAHDQGIEIAVGPEQWLESLAMAERILGRSPDSGLNAKFIKTLRDYQRGAENPLAAFLASRDGHEATKQ